MQIMITHSSLARTRVVSLSRTQLGLTLAALVLLIVLASGAVYHFIFLTAAREGWPVVSQLVKLVVHDEIAQRDRFMRENLDAMATKVGEMQARMVKLEAMGDRVTGLAGVKPEDVKMIKAPPMAASGASAVAMAGRGGPFIPLDHPSLDQLNLALQGLESMADQHGDLLTFAESRLFESRLRSLMVPNSKPIDTTVGSGFGFRPDPFTNRPALHTGLDFPADVGTTIQAAAGGVVLSTDWHPQYGHLLEIDHGNGLVTRYAHTSAILVKAGDLVKRGQAVARVGTTGRSTGPHLHFEVVVDGVPQDPAKFLAAAPAPGLQAAAGRTVAMAAAPRVVPPAATPAPAPAPMAASAAAPARP